MLLEAHGLSETPCEVPKRAMRRHGQSRIRMGKSMVIAKERDGEVVHHLAIPFFRNHHRFAHSYARLAMSPHCTLRYLAWCFAQAVRFQEHPTAILMVTPSREHDREDELQA